MKYCSKQKAYTSLCGPNCKLSLLGTMQVVQDGICEYFESMGAGQITTKQNHNCVWVFLKNKFKFHGDILWNEDYTAECFISFRSSVKVIVDTLFYDKNGKLAMHCKTEMCLVDLNTIKIAKITNDILNDSYVAIPSSTDMEFEKILDNVDGYVCSKKVLSTHIDFCGHCNNIEYVRLLLDTYTASELSSLSIDTFEICYYQQSLEGDMLDIYKTSTQNVDLFEVKNGANICLKCKFVKNK